MNEQAVRPPATPDEWKQYFDLRWRVLRAAGGQPRGSERDTLDDVVGTLSIVHAALWAGEQIIAVGRLHRRSATMAQIRYMAVSPDRARQGWGSEIIKYLHQRAHAGGTSTIELDARESAVKFYERHGYRVIGDAPTKWEICHRRMAVDL
jgi:predicted GNAT family N-acyltransferase